MLIELRDAVFAYPGAEPLLKGFNLTFAGDRKLGLIGPNGCGKTTLFHLIMGLRHLDHGELYHNSQPVRERGDLVALRRDIGLLFQDADDQLFSPTVLEDVAFGPLNLGYPPAAARERAESTLADLGLAGFGQRLTHQLSGGEKKLVSLATILAMEPKALLLDEPTNNLDPDTRQRLIRILRDIPIGYIIISHDWDFLDDTCDELWAMSQGQVTQCAMAYLHEHKHAHPQGDHPHRHGHQHH